jgi:hypothetical protein
MTDIRPLLTLDELAKILRRAPSTIRSDLKRAPHRVPPPVKRREWKDLRWRPETVSRWLDEGDG